MICKCAEIFCWKNVSSFCSAKATHIFSAKNIRILYIESAKMVNEMTLNEFVKLTALWINRALLSMLTVHLLAKCLVEVLLISTYNIFFDGEIRIILICFGRKKCHLSSFAGKTISSPLNDYGFWNFNVTSVTNSGAKAALSYNDDVKTYLTRAVSTQNKVSWSQHLGLCQHIQCLLITLGFLHGVSG